MMKPTTFRAWLYAIPLFLTPFADKIVPILEGDKWPSPMRLVACAIVGLIASAIGLRAYYDGSYQRHADDKAKANGNGAAAATVGVLVAAMMLAGCIGPNPERNALAAIQGSKVTVNSALKGWDAWLGVEYRRADKLPPPQDAERIAELQGQERTVMATLSEYNNSLATADAAWDAYDAAKSVENKTKLDAAIAAVNAAAAAYTNIVNIWKGAQ